MSKLPLPVICLILLPMLLLPSGCSQRSSDADNAAARGILLVGNGGEPKDLDPHTVTGVPENHIISALIEGLVNYHPTDDLLVEPGVAERWESDPTATVWTFYLRENARWSNGDPVVAEDFVFSWERMLHPSLGAEYAEQLFILKNAEAYNRGQLKDFRQVGVKALHPQRLEVTLIGPTPYFLGMLQHYSWYPVHPGTIRKLEALRSRGAGWTRPEHYVGNGPFVLAEWTVNQIVRVTRSPTYWDAASVLLQEIRFYPIESATVEETAFLNGQLHMTNVVRSDKISWWKNNRAECLRQEPYLGTYFYRLNLERPALRDVRVRKALNLAVDRRQIVEKVTLGGQRPATGFVPEGMLGYPTPAVLRFDPAEARRLLAEAGYPQGRGFPVFEILYNTFEDHKKIAEAIQQMWKQHLGIDVTLINQDWKVYIDSQQRMDYDISRSGWIADFMDPITFLSLWTSGNGNNNTGWKNQRYDQLILAAQKSSTTEEHYSILLQAENILLEELPIIPIYWYSRNYLIDRRVQNWHPKLLDNRPWKRISLTSQ